ncbi:MAG: hypothetical protein LBI15_09660 [Dysgonamonadaceae bacterium]|jgi:hypothetical protein|nr:hypothetical protein [Dysgonamonadaceae bacterium]
MKIKKISSVLFASFLLFATGCEKEQFYGEDDSSSQELSDVQSVTKSGEENGVNYSLNGLVINPDVVIINEGSAEIESDMQEISGGILKLSNLSNELAESLKIGTVLYVNTIDFTALQKITAVQKSGNSYLLSVEQAQLGELFDGGSIDVSVDLNKSAGLRSAGGKNLYDKYLEINLQDEYDLGNGMKFNPSTDIKMTYNIRLEFSRFQILPTIFSSIFECNLAINPVFHFENSMNGIYNFELGQYIPEALMELIKAQEIDIEIPINTLGIETLPAKISIRDIQIPVTVEANLSEESTVSFGLNGTFRLGYKISINGLIPRVTPVFENSIAASFPSTTNLNGEVITNSKIIIDPVVSILNDSYKAGGDIIVEKSAIMQNYNALPGQPTVGLEVNANVAATVLVDLLLIRVPVNILNQEIASLSYGQVNRSMIFSDMTYNVTSTNSTNLLITSRLFATNFAMKYKYPILGKRVPNKLLISYDVFQDNGTSRITSVTNQEITLTDITADSFRFRLDVPFRLGGLLLTTPQSRSFIRNIVIRDHNGFEYQGIFNSSRNVVENNFEIRR